MTTLPVIRYGNEHFKVHYGICVIVSRSAHKKIHAHYGKQKYLSQDNLYSAVCIMTYSSNTEYEYTSILATFPFLLAGVFSNEIVMLRIPANQKEATLLKMYVFHETSLFKLNLIQ